MLPPGIQAADVVTTTGLTSTTPGTIVAARANSRIWILSLTLFGNVAGADSIAANFDDGTTAIGVGDSAWFQGVSANGIYQSSGPMVSRKAADALKYAILGGGTCGWVCTYAYVPS